MVQINKLVNVSYVECWNFSIFGNPKLTVVCGECKGLFKTRDYVTIKNTQTIGVFCPHCKTWNNTGLQYDYD